MSKRVYLPLIWFRERDSRGQSWCVVLTSDEIHEDIVGNLGLTLLGGFTILIWAGQDRRELLDTVLHEVAHAHCWASKREVAESKISTVVPQIVGTLIRQGWQPPPLPGARGARGATFPTTPRSTRAPLERHDLARRDRASFRGWSEL